MDPGRKHHHEDRSVNAAGGILVAVDTAGDIELKRQLAELRRGGFEVRSIHHKTAIPGWRQACAHVHYSDPSGDEFVLTVRADGSYKHVRSVRG